jgi:cell division protein FtsI/penicillin-binding protein 2
MAFGSLIQDERQARKVKSLFLSAVIGTFLFLLIIRLFYLQVILADLNLRLSKENAMREKLLFSPRQILDRNGVVLPEIAPPIRSVYFLTRLGIERRLLTPYV